VEELLIPYTPPGEREPRQRTPGERAESGSGTTGEANGGTPGRPRWTGGADGGTQGRPRLSDERDQAALLVAAIVRAQTARRSRGRDRALDAGTEPSEAPHDPGRVDCDEVAGAVREAQSAAALRLTREADGWRERTAVRSAVARFKTNSDYIRLSREAGRERFPLRTAAPTAAVTEEAAEAKLREVLGDAPQRTNPTPNVAHEVDSRAVADLPRLRERSKHQQPTFRAGQVGSAALEFGPEGRPTWDGVKQWGRSMRTAELPPEDRDDLRRLLWKEIQSGAVRVATEVDAVRLLTPIFLARHGTTGKPRLVHDLRALNALLAELTVKYPRVRDALLLKGAVATKLDVASAFKHILLREGDVGLMAFEVDGVRFVWTALPFGCSQSPALFSRALEPTMQRIRDRGVQIVVYVDDIFVVAADAAALDAAALAVVEELQRDGWTVATDKVFPHAYDRLVFLGLRVDIDRQRLAVPPGKAAKLQRLTAAALGKTRVTLSELDKIVGLLAFFGEAFPAVGLAWRGLCGAAAEAKRLPGRHVWTRGLLACDLAFWSSYADKLPAWSDHDHGIEGFLTAVTDASEDGAGFLAWRDTAAAPDVDAWATARAGANAGRADAHAGRAAATGGESDASGTGSMTDPWMGALPLPADAIGGSSTAREACGLLLTLRALIARKVDISGKTLKWFSDSKCAVAAVGNWRSAGSPLLVKNLFEIFCLCHELRIVVEPHWVSRDAEWLPAADYLSRAVGRRGQTEWAVSHSLLRWACDHLRLESLPTIDTFATGRNRRCARFHSTGVEPGSLGDAFASTWHGLAWVHPPYSLVSRAFLHWDRHGDGDMLLCAPAALVRGLPRAPDREVQWPGWGRLIDIHGAACPLPPTQPLVIAWYQRATGTAHDG
jgi:hypothetical protein